MIKISPSSLHERHQCRRCIWIQYNHGWSWPWSAGLYPRFSALEENYVPTLNCCDVLNNFEADGSVTEAEWLGSKGLVQGRPLIGANSHGRGDVIIGGEFDLMATYTKNGIKSHAIIDAKTSGYKDFDALKKWAKKLGVTDWKDEAELRAEYNRQYSEKYLPQLASYAYCMEFPASAANIAEYLEAEPEELWPRKPTKKRRRVPKDHDNPIAYEYVSAAGILMFGFEKNLELHGDKFHFTCASTYVELIEPQPETSSPDWMEIITPLAQKVCDIIAEPEMPPHDETCENCVNEREHQALLDG